MEVLEIVNNLRAVAWANTFSTSVTKYAAEMSGAMLRIGYAGGGGAGADVNGNGEAAELLSFSHAGQPFCP